MLTLTRRTEEAILIGSDIRIVIKRIDGEVVKLGIEAPKNLAIYREEIFAKISQQNQEALAQAQDKAAPVRLNWPKPPDGTAV